MGTKRESYDSEAIRLQLEGLVNSYKIKLTSDDLRDKVISIISIRKSIKSLGVSLLPKDIDSALDRILYYLKQYPRTVIQVEELAIVAGIEEYARRIRQLRVEFGWQILAGKTAKEVAEEGKIAGIDVSRMKASDYILLSTENDRDAAYRWNLANTIKKGKGGAKSKILKFFQANVGQVLSYEELRYVANGASEWGRRIRELRTEDAWPIELVDGGGYVLQENKQGEPHDRNISQSVYSAVLDRDKHKCRKCGWSFSMLSPSDKRKRLELHHVEHHVAGGSNEAENLITLCNVHHDVVHSIGKSWGMKELESWINE
jgi:hypothetical protein